MKKFTFAKRALIPMLLMPLMYIVLFAALMGTSLLLENVEFLYAIAVILAFAAVFQLGFFALFMVFCEIAAIWYAVKALKNGEPKHWIAVIIVLAVIIAVAATLFWMRYWHGAMGV